MTIAISNTSNTNTFDFWKNRTNDMAYAMSTKVLTTESNTTSGNCEITGAFTANTLVANGAIRGGNSSVSNTLQVSSNLQVTGSTFTVGSNVTINAVAYGVGNSTVNAVTTSTQLVISQSGNLVANSSGITINSVPVTPAIVNTQVSGNTTAIIDSFSMSQYRGGEYTISVFNNAANGHQISKLLILHDGSSAPLLTDYSVLYSNNQLVVFSANANSTHVRLLSTTQLADASSNVQIKALRTLVVT